MREAPVKIYCKTRLCFTLKSIGQPFFSGDCGVQDQRRNASMAKLFKCLWCLSSLELTGVRNLNCCIRGVSLVPLGLYPWALVSF